MPESLDKKIESILEQVEKPARYIGGEIGSIRKQQYDLRLVLSYPDVYEIGTANQAVQLLYSLVNDSTGVWAERAYCPWPDMSELMRREGVPLFTLESWSPVRDADVWGITLQHELNFTNILEMMDLAGVPLHWSDREDSHPLVFAGGPCASNPHPVGEFFDFIIIGDGELVLPRVLDLCRETAGLARPQRLERFAELDGVYVPANPRPVTREVIPELPYGAIPLKPVVPSMHSVHDRAPIEIQRGCTRGCRFCMAGTWYRPVRERSAADVCRAAVETSRRTGYQEISLSSLSSTDHSNIKEILQTLRQSHPGISVSLPSLRMDPDSLRLLNLSGQRRGSITLAPEAGTQRLRDVINKQVSEQDIEDALAEAFAGGCSTVKLYFMMGLPTETEADMQGIIDVAVQARAIGRRVSRSPGRAQVNVSIASFIPKPHTPFQWVGMNSREQLREKHDFMRRNMPRKQIKLSMHDVEPSLVEGAIARGNARTAAAIEAAWRAGARFDAWTEYFATEPWEQGFAAIGTSVEAEATRIFSPEEELPWDDIDPRVSKDFLLGEWEKAQRGETTGDCRKGDCGLCGVCEDDIRMIMELI